MHQLLVCRGTRGRDARAGMSSGTCGVLGTSHTRRCDDRWVGVLELIDIYLFSTGWQIIRCLPGFST